MTADGDAQQLLTNLVSGQTMYTGSVQRVGQLAGHSLWE